MRACLVMKTAAFRQDLADLITQMGVECVDVGDAETLTALRGERFQLVLADRTASEFASLPLALAVAGEPRVAWLLRPAEPAPELLRTPADLRLDVPVDVMDLLRLVDETADACDGATPV